MDGLGSGKESDRQIPVGMSIRTEQDVGLFPLRVSTKYPSTPNGADIAFVCTAENGQFYYCKGDSPIRPVRATEWFSTRLAEHLGIAVAPISVIEDLDSQTYFGSLRHPSTADEGETGLFLNTPTKNELGQPSVWPGNYLSQLYALDLFLNNPDRSLANFVLIRDGGIRRLCAIDFAAADLAMISGREFPVAENPTRRVGKYIRSIHGFVGAAAIEMLDRIAMVPSGMIENFVQEIPGDWMTNEQREGLCDAWSKKGISTRLSAIRAGLSDESLL